MNYILPTWESAPCNIHAYTTVRSTWDGRRPVEERNQQLQALLTLPAQPTWLRQTHSNIAIDAAKAEKDALADAVYTFSPNHICAVLTADCLPILICHKQGSCVAAIHAGWRGLSGGIIENTLAALGQPGEDMLAWLGPAIGPLQFEVGEEVYSAFTHQHAQSAAAFVPKGPGKWLANLYELAIIRLQLGNVRKIYGGDYCTYTQKELFFSHRRDHGNTGRMASIIWISQ